MNVLFIGGTGIISSAVTRLAVKRNITLTLLNRGNHNHSVPRGVTTLTCDVNDEAQVHKLLEGKTYDAIVDFVAFTPSNVKRDVRLFKDYTSHYVFISSASAYQKPLPKLPITEDIPLDNPYWNYSENKKRCEEYLNQLDIPDFNVTIIRPTHTYTDNSMVFQVQPWDHPFTIVKHILEGKPLVIPGDGSTRWTLTYNRDFAEGFLDLLGNKKAYNDTFHLTSEKAYTWNALAHTYFELLNIKPNIKYLSPEIITQYFPELKGPLYGDNLHDSIYDNSKVKAIAPNYRSVTEYPTVLKQALADFRNNPEKQTVNQDFLDRYNKMIDEN